MNNLMRRFIIEISAGYTMSQLVDEDWDQYDPDLAEFVLHLDMDELMNHPNPYVRAAVAKEGYGLDILKDDPSWEVRITLVKMGYYLDKFINDPDSRVKDWANIMMA